MNLQLSRSLATFLAAAGLALPALARPDSGVEICHRDVQPEKKAIAFDPETGRDLSTYPPDRAVDFLHMKLAIDIPDMNVPRLAAVQTLSVLANGAPVTTLTLDAHLLDVQSVSASNRQVKFENDGRHLKITFDPPIQPGEGTEIKTAYAVNDPPAGLYWTPESPAWPGRPAQIHTQGESETNSYWFPCHDFPNERLTTELVVTVPGGYLVSSNGREVEPVKHTGSGVDARDTFHWLQDKPQVNYLVSMVVGKFDVVDVSGGGPVPMPVYVPPGRGRDVMPTYRRTPRMVDLFGTITGEPYPWARYAQLVVWNFGAGGMENTSATTLFDTAVLSPEGLHDGDLDGLISHELAHQWFGDLITCRSWEHIWLNEGFATYFTALWMESRDGEEAYQANIRGEFDSVIAGDKAEAPYSKAMVTTKYTDPGQQFGGAANPYPKGASILHMLRRRLGDDMFFGGLRAYVNQKKLQTAESGDFRRALEDTSGESLLRFFRQWCERPGVPDLDITVTTDSATGELGVLVKQQQNIDGHNPAFEFDLPVWAGDRQVSRVGTVHMDGKEGSGWFKVPASVQVVAIDPELDVLAKMTIHQSTDRWLAQLDRGPTWAARVQAARALAGDHSQMATAALSRLARDTSAAASLRVEAVNALKDRGDAGPVIEVSAAQDLPPDVGVAVCEAAGALGADTKLDSNEKTRLKSLLSGCAASNSSQRVRAAAIRGLGKIKAVDQLPVVLKGVDSDSQSDRIRQAALETLADFDVPQGLPAAIHYAMPGALNRTRPVAIQTVAKLAHHDRDAAYKALAGLVNDREVRAWRAAGQALVDLGDGRAIDELNKLAAAKRDPADQKIVRGWAESIGKKTEHAAVTPVTEPAAATKPPSESATAPATSAQAPAQPIDFIWVPITNPVTWAWNEGETKQVERDAVDYFKKRGYVAARKNGSMYLLCWDTPAMHLSPVGAPWKIENASITYPGAGTAVITFTLDENGEQAFGDFTQHNVQRKLAILVDGRATTAPRLVSPISRQGQITGRFTKDEAEHLAEAIRSGKIEFRIAIEPGERSDEPKLIETFTAQK